MQINIQDGKLAHLPYYSHSFYLPPSLSLSLSLLTIDITNILSSFWSIVDSQNMENMQINILSIGVK